MSTITVSARQARAGVAVQSNRLNHIDITRALVTVRIGVFFDGTNNNAGNIALGEQCRASTASAQGQDETDREAIVAHCKPYMDEPGSSYSNGTTNVARLFDLYRSNEAESPEEAGGEYFLRAYIDGIGTTAGEPDSLLSQGLGTGSTGIEARVDQALHKDLRELIDRFASERPDVWIEAIEFDVFGFSRGAAAARDFVNQLNRKARGPLAAVIAPSRLQLKPGFDWNRDIQVGFVGLFDTVVAVGSLADGLDVRDGDDGEVQVALPAGCARQVVQLVARDEHRANFMLTTVKPEHREIALPGAHSDVGGSYHEDHEGPLLLTQPVGYDEGRAVEGDEAATASKIRHSRAFKEAAAALRQWQALLGIDDSKQLGIESWAWVRHQRSRWQAAPEPRLRVYAAVRLHRPIDWRYQLIPLRVMHKLAIEAGVSFREINDDDESYMLPDELQPIAVKLLAGQPLSYTEEALLRRQYLHVSSHWNFELAARYLGKGPISADTVYVSRPDPSGRRGIRPNE